MDVPYHTAAWRLPHQGIVILPLWVPEVFSQSSLPPLRLALDRKYPLFTSLFFFLSSFSPPLWPPRPQESKVIQIQRDHLLAASRPVAAMERSKVTCPIQVCWRKLGPHQEGLLWPSHEVHWTPCWLGAYVSSSSLMLLIYTNDLLWSAIGRNWIEAKQNNLVLQAKNCKQTN